MNKKTILGLLVAAAAVLSPVVAKAVPVLGAQIFVANDGHVIAKYLGHTAGYSNDLYLYSPNTFGGIIFNNHSTPVGTTVDLGYFTAGTELIFKIYVNNTGHSFFTGSGSLNPDQIAHAVVDTAYSPTETYVGFEDIFGGGDRDFDDLKYSFTNVGTERVPDASSTVMMLGAALLGVAGIARRFRR